MLLNFGKGLWQWPLKSRPSGMAETAQALQLIQHGDDAALQIKIRELTIKQMATTLRMQHEDSEDLTMLASLESLALAGEINFMDYVGRVQNLFPMAMESFDVSLRMKVASLMM
jgi:hypothetical protein